MGLLEGKLIGELIIEDVREHVYKRVMFISLGLIIEGNLLDSTFIRVSLLERIYQT